VFRSTIIYIVITLVFALPQAFATQVSKEQVVKGINLLIRSKNISFEDLDKRYGDLNKVISKNGYQNDPKIKHKLGVLSNLHFIKQRFDKCMKDGIKGKKYFGRVLDQVREAAFSECIEKFASDLPNTYKMAKDVHKVTSFMQYKDMNQKLIDESLKSGIESLIAFRKKFKNQSIEPEAIKEVVCSKMPECDDSVKEMLNKYYDDAVKKADHIKPNKPSSIVSSINTRIMKINKLVKEVRTKNDDGYFYNSPVITDRYKKTYATYKKEYTDMLLNNEFNNLMFTERFRKSVGGLKDEDDLEQTYHKTGYKFKEHNTIGYEDVDEAFKQAQSKMLSQISLLLRQKDKHLYHKDHARRVSTKFIRHFPASVGKMLIKDPSKATAVCGVVSEAVDKDESDAAWDKAFKIGGMALGIGLMATGIGAGVGSVVLTGAAATTASTIATGTVVASVALGVTEGAYQTKEAIQAYNKNQMIEQSVLIGTGDDQSIEDARVAMAEFETAQFDAMMSVGFAALDVGAVKSAIMVSKYGKDLTSKSMKGSDKAKYINELTDNFNDIVQDKELMKYFAKHSDKIGKEKMTEFIALMSRIKDDNIRNSLLLQIKDFKPKKLKKLVEETVHNAKKCS
jgi:hypothetical protein